MLSKAGHAAAGASAAALAAELAASPPALQFSLLGELPPALQGTFLGNNPNPHIVGRFSQAQLNAFVSKVAAARSTAATNAATNAATPLHLSGTLHAVYYPVAMYYGYVIRTDASGSISPLGHVTANEPIGPPVFAAHSQPEIHDEIQDIHNKLGALTLSFHNTHWVNSHDAVGDYTISGGTGAYIGAFGSGHVQVTSNGNRSSGKVTIIYS